MQFVLVILVLKYIINHYLQIFKVKDSHKELVDFSITCVMATIVFLITNFYYQMNNSLFFYVGFIVGTQIIVLKKILFPSNREDINSRLEDVLFLYY